MKRLIWGVFLTSQLSLASIQWQKHLGEMGATDFSKHSYCVRDSAGEISGENTKMRVRLASVSKLLVSLWAVDKLGADYRFKTKVYVYGDKAFIDGNYDPYMGYRKMFFILSELNRAGLTHLSELTFTEDFRIYSHVFSYVKSRKTIAPTRVKKSLEWYFNTDKWDAGDKKYYQQLRNEIIEYVGSDLYENKVRFSVDQINISNENPFLEAAGEVDVFEISSAPLHRYLKFMNIVSNNHVADEIYDFLGGEQGFDEYAVESLDLTQEQIKMYSGSGLPLIVDNVRYDNFATCEVVVKLINRLQVSLENQGFQTTDVISVLGGDRGTLVKRLGPDFTYNSVMAKTGSLYHTSALAGNIFTSSGPYNFAIFNMELNRRDKTKKFQNQILSELFDMYGEPQAISYRSKPFVTFEYHENEDDD